MIREKYAKRIIDSAPIDLYMSSNFPAVTWPYRMNAAHHASNNLIQGTENYVVDSSFQKEEIGVEYVLDKAETLDADVVALVDEYGSRKKTVDSILKDIEKVDDHTFDGDILVPLQPPHDECYKDLEGVGDWYGIGGVARSHASEKVQAAKDVRAVAGDDIYLHGLGWGATDEVVEAVRENPDLVDSIDSKSAHDKAMSENLDEIWTANGNKSGRGAVICMFAAAYALEACRRMNPDMTLDPNESKADSGAEVTW